QVNDGAMRSRQAVERAGQQLAQLALAHLLFGPGVAARAQIGVEIFHRLVEPLQRFQGLAVGDRKDPGRHLAASVVAVGARPDDEHRVVEQLFDQTRAARHPIKKSAEPRVVDAIQVFEGVQFARGDLRDQPRLVLLDGVVSPRVGLAVVAAPAEHRVLPVRSLIPTAERKVHRIYNVARRLSFVLWSNRWTAPGSTARPTRSPGFTRVRPCITMTICALPAFTSSSVSAPVGSTTMTSACTGAFSPASDKCSGRMP